MEFPMAFIPAGWVPAGQDLGLQLLGGGNRPTAQTSPLAYVGQVLSVVENGEAKVYKIKDTAGTLEPLGADAVAVATDGEVEEMMDEVFGTEEVTG